MYVCMCLFRRLHIQLWSKGIFKNKIVGEAVFNLYDWFMLTYHRKTQQVRFLHSYIHLYPCIHTSRPQVQPFRELEDAKRKLNSSGFSASAFDDASVGDRAIDDILAGRSAEQYEVIQEDDLGSIHIHIYTYIHTYIHTYILKRIYSF